MFQSTLIFHWTQMKHSKTSKYHNSVMSRQRMLNRWGDLSSNPQSRKHLTLYNFLPQLGFNVSANSLKMIKPAWSPLVWGMKEMFDLKQRRCEVQLLYNGHLLAVMVSINTFPSLKNKPRLFESVQQTDLLSVDLRWDRRVVSLM